MNMAIPVSHDIVVRPVENDTYPFLATCSCNWQAHGRTREAAIQFAQNHGGLQAYGGNPVSIDVSQVPPQSQPSGVIDEQRPEGSVEAAGQEPAPESNATAAPEAGSGS